MSVTRGEEDETERTSAGGGLRGPRHTPRVLVVETKYPERITALLSGRMALIEQLCVHDYLYRALSSD